MFDPAQPGRDIAKAQRIGQAGRILRVHRDRGDIHPDAVLQELKVKLAHASRQQLAARLSSDRGVRLGVNGAIETIALQQPGDALQTGARLQPAGIGPPRSS